MYWVFWFFVIVILIVLWKIFSGENYKTLIVSLVDELKSLFVVQYHTYLRNSDVFASELLKALNRYSAVAPDLLNFSETDTGRFFQVKVEFFSKNNNLDLFKIVYKKIIEKGLISIGYYDYYVTVFSTDFGERYIVTGYYAVTKKQISALIEWEQMQKDKLSSFSLIDEELENEIGNSENGIFNKVEFSGEIRAGSEILEGFCGVFFPLILDIKTHCHWLIVGSSGSGKSVLLLYLLNSILNMDFQIFIADFKASGDFCGIVCNYAEFDNCLDLLNDFYEQFREIKLKKINKKILLIFDEFPSFLINLENSDKRKAAEIKAKIAEILMQGRSLPGGGSACFWCVCQRADSDYFMRGARENYMCKIALGNISRESRNMLFSGEDFPEDYNPKVGEGILSADGYRLKFFVVPKVDKERLILHLGRKAGRKAK